MPRVSFRLRFDDSIPTVLVVVELFVPLLLLLLLPPLLLLLLMLAVVADAVAVVAGHPGLLLLWVTQFRLHGLSGRCDAFP